MTRLIFTSHASIYALVFLNINLNYSYHSKKFLSVKFKKVKNGNLKIKAFETSRHLSHARVCAQNWHAKNQWKVIISTLEKKVKEILLAKSTRIMLEVMLSCRYLVQLRFNS